MYLLLLYSKAPWLKSRHLVKETWKTLPLCQRAIKKICYPYTSLIQNKKPYLLIVHSCGDKTSLQVIFYLKTFE